MSNEAQIGCGLSINKTVGGNLHYQAGLQAFVADVNGTNGPTPGSFTAAIGSGTIASLANLTVPGLCRVANLDATNFVTVGVWNGSTFFPFIELKPGEAFVFRLSRHFGIEYGSGTGTVTRSYSLKVVADTGPCNVDVSAFEA